LTSGNRQQHLATDQNKPVISRAFLFFLAGKDGQRQAAGSRFWRWYLDGYHQSISFKKARYHLLTIQVSPAREKARSKERVSEAKSFGDWAELWLRG
jgi:hypothetical protein